MELFSLTCTTCKSRLKVRDQAAIGQILACPKCGGMVMIKPPPAWEQESEDKSDLPTATEIAAPDPLFDQTVDSGAFDGVEDLLSDSPPKIQPPVNQTPSPTSSGPQTPRPRFVGGPPVVRSAGAAAKASATPPGAVVPPPLPGGAAAAAATASNGRGAPAAKRDSEVLAPPPPAETDPARQQPAIAADSGRRYWLWMAGSVALGVVLAFAAVAAALYAFGGPRHASRGTAKGPSVVQGTQTQIADPAASPMPADSQTPPLAQVDVQSNQPPETTKNSNTAVVANDSDPPGLTRQPLANRPPPAASNDPLAKFDRLVGGPSDDPLAKPAGSAAKSAPSSSPTDVVPARPLAPRPPPREVDVAKRLADPLPAIEAAGTALADFVQLMSDLSTIPITLELPFVPVTADTNVSIRLTNTTVGKAIDQALAPLRLQSVVVDDQLVIRRFEPEEIKAFPHPVKDLAASEEQMTELAELLKAVVEPAAWGDGEGGGSITVDAAKGLLAITHRRAVQFQVLTAIEKLRRARTPPLPKVMPLDAALFALDTRSSLAKPKLEKAISLNYSQPTRLVTILERLSQAAGMRIVVDWRDVASAGWNPAGEASLVVSNQPLAAALDALLSPLDLTWRIIDGQTLQVVTPARLADQGELEVYKVGDLAGDPAAGEAILARIRANLSEGAFTAGGGSGEIRYEEDGKCLLAWLSQPRQRELEALLARWRSEK